MSSATQPSRPLRARGQAQGRTAARNLLGAEEAYDRLPHFSTDQYDPGMEYAGHLGADGYDALVLRGDPGTGIFNAFWIAGGRVAAAMHANEWGSTSALRSIVTAERVDLAGLRDPSVRLGEVVGGPTVP